jgi:protein tyrosine phosphatase
LADERNLADTSRFSFSAALHPSNRVKNRYRDILPFDHNRIASPAVPYINASSVQSIDQRRYIVAQGPLPHTVPDFWTTIAENKCPFIVMLCNPVEKGAEKCAVYWPQSTDSPLELNGIFRVRLKRSEPLSGVNAQLRELEVECSKTNGVHRCIQLHYTGWPDHGVPEQSDDFLNFLRHWRELHSSHGQSALPVVVHCRQVSLCTHLFDLTCL